MAQTVAKNQFLLVFARFGLQKAFHFGNIVHNIPPPLTYCHGASKQACKAHENNEMGDIKITKCHNEMGITNMMKLG